MRYCKLCNGVGDIRRLSGPVGKPELVPRRTARRLTQAVARS